jgi:tetratricopeptide (TPR) repeat protein
VKGRGVPVTSLVFFFLAALSKETALTLPVLLFAYDYSFKRDSVFRPTPETFYLLLKRYLPYLVVAGIYFILRTYAIGGFAPVKVHAELSGYEYFINVFPLFAQYLGKMILPINLNAAYVFYPISSLLEWKGIMAVAVTLGFIFTLYLARDRNRVVFFSLLLVVIPLLPAFYIPALGEHTFAERYLYLPSAGFVIIVSLGLCGIASLDVLRGRAVPIMLSVVIIMTALYSAGTIKRNPVWKDSLTLWSDTVKKSPDSYGVRNNLGLAYHNLERHVEATREYKEALRLNPDYALPHNNLGLVYYDMGRHAEAIIEYKEAIRLNPDFEGAHNNLGNAYYNQGRIDEAIVEYEETIRLKPDFAGAHYNLGRTYYDKGRMDEAIREYEETIRVKPDFADAHNNLGLVHFNQGRISKAIEEYKVALRLSPDAPEPHYNIGNAYYNQGRIDEAVEEFIKTLELNPEHPRAHNNLGNAYDDKGLREKAIEEYKQAIRLKPGFAEAHNNLGTAYAKQGRMDEAIEEYRETLRLNPGLANARFNLALAYRERGLKTDAIREFKQYLRLNPGDNEARKMIEGLLAEGNRL